MRRATIAMAAFALLGAPAGLPAEDLESGLPVGKTMLSMPLQKVGGAEDGVNRGTTICYT